MYKYPVFLAILCTASGTFAYKANNANNANNANLPRKKSPRCATFPEKLDHHVLHKNLIERPDRFVIARDAYSATFPEEGDLKPLGVLDLVNLMIDGSEGNLRGFGRRIVARDGQPIDTTTIAELRTYLLFKLWASPMHRQARGVEFGGPQGITSRTSYVLRVAMASDNFTRLQLSMAQDLLLKLSPPSDAEFASSKGLMVAQIKGLKTAALRHLRTASQALVEKFQKERWQIPAAHDHQSIVNLVNSVYAVRKTRQNRLSEKLTSQAIDWELEFGLIDSSTGTL